MENNTADTTKDIQQNANTLPEGSGAQAEKTFTQDEVNRIVSDRLARERAKAEPTADELHTKEIEVRENALSCKEYISEKKLPKGFLEVCDTSNIEKFKQQTEKLLKAFPQIIEPFNNPVGVTNGGNIEDDMIAKAFNLKH